jgi:hypothetical protein
MGDFAYRLCRSSRGEFALESVAVCGVDAVDVGRYLFKF